MTGEIWVLGATGRVGREAVERLQQAGAEVVVAGRNRERLTQVSPDARAVTGSLDEVCARLATEAPTVVINTVGPFAVTAPQVARACPPGTHYVDVANELSSQPGQAANLPTAVSVTDRPIWNESAHSPEAELSRQSGGYLRSACRPRRHRQ